MAKNKTFHHVYLTFENDEHPVVVDWLATKLEQCGLSIRVALDLARLRKDKLTQEMHGGGTMIKLSFITNFLGDQQLYTAYMGEILKLIDQASKYVEIKMHFEESDVRRNRFMLTRDLGLLINGSTPIEMRCVGKVVKLLDPTINDVWVAGEPNATRKAVGDISRMLREYNHHILGFDWFVRNLESSLSKDVAVYIRKVDDTIGQVVHARGYDQVDYKDERHLTYLDAVKAGKVPDVFNLQKSKDWNFDFIAFMVTMLEAIDDRRQAFKTYGGADVVPYEYIRTTMEDIIDHEATA